MLKMGGMGKEACGNIDVLDLVPHEIDIYIWVVIWLGLDPRMDTKKTCVEKRLDYMFTNVYPF